MSAYLEQGSKKSSKGSVKVPESSSTFLESSLSWCLSQLLKTSSLQDLHSSRLKGTDNQLITRGEKARDADKKLRAVQWRALVAIRTQHIKGGGSQIARYKSRGGVPPLLNLLRRPESSRKFLDLALSILANCCTEKETRLEVRKHEGVFIVVDVLKRNISVETVQNRAARALGNLAMDPEGSAEVHSAGGVQLLLLCLSLSPSPSSPTTSNPAPEVCASKLECAQSAARALFYLSDSPANRLLLLSQGALPALALYIAPDFPPGLRRASLRALHELTRGCGAECAREISRSEALSHLGVLASGEDGQPMEELALKTLANLCAQACLRPMVGSLGVIKKFVEEVKKDPLKSSVFVKALCLCCREAVNRAKVKESKGLEVLIGFLSAHQSHPLTKFAFLACVDFVYDESALEQLQELGLVPLLIKRLVQLAQGEEAAAGKPGSNASCTSPCNELMASEFDSFDFSSLEGSKREDVSKDQTSGSASFLSLRSWLVSEGLISSEGELSESPSGSETVGGSPHSSLCSELSQTSNPRHHMSSPTARCRSSRHSSSSSSSTPVSPQSTQMKSVPGSPCSSRFSFTSSSQSPYHISSPPRKRSRALSSSSSSSTTSSHFSVVSFDNPPMVSKTVFHHPYHPEPWTPESPILLLLSRFSHASEPSTSLINTSVISGLLFYLVQHRDPSGRCFRMLNRLSCNPNCLQALVKTGAVALIRQRLCVREENGIDGRRNGVTDRQSEKVKAKVTQLGLGLLSNLRVQGESGYGSGVLTHIMLSGSEADRLFCVLSLPLVTSNRALLKKLLVDSGGLAAALKMLDFHSDGDTKADKFKAFFTCWLHPCEEVFSGKFHFLYASLLLGCLSSLLAIFEGEKKQCNVACQIRRNTTRPTMKTSANPGENTPESQTCPYLEATHDVTFLLDDGSLFPANREAISGTEDAKETKSEYFRALLMGGFGEAQRSGGDAICIRDVKSGMLLPVLHYLHGCRLIESYTSAESSANANCLVLSSLVSDGLGGPHDVAERCGEHTFENSPVAQLVIGACRFLVSGLQQEAENLCVELLYSVLENATRRCCATGCSHSPTPKDQASSETKASKQLCEPDAGDAPKCSEQLSTPSQSPRKVPKTGPSLDGDTDGAWLRCLLQQMYCFSQRYSCLRMGQACLSILLQPSASHSSFSADCFLNLGQEEDCAEGLRRDIMNYVKMSLS